MSAEPLSAEPLSARRTDLTIWREMPYPIATAWHRLSICTSDSERCDQLLGCYEVTLRTVGAFLLQDYLRGAASSKVEAAIHKLDRPSYGHWIGLIRALLKALASRSEPAPFVPDAGQWFFRGSGKKESQAAKLLDEINQQRNRIVHGGPAVGAEHSRERASELQIKLRQLLGSMRWLTSYRIFRVLELDPTRNRTFQGRVQFWVGHVEHNEPVYAEWEAPLLKGLLYLTDRTGEHLLELFPFLQVLTGETRQEHCFLLREAPRLKRLVLSHDPSGTEITLGVKGNQGEVTFSRWLEERSDREVYFPNRDHGKSLRISSPEVPLDEELNSSRFRVLGLLGDGGMGKVWRVHDQEFDEEAALKVLDAAVADDPIFRERFKREAHTMSRINHPSILSIQEFGTLEDGRLFLKMPVANGGSLLDRIQKGGLSEDLILPWARQMLRALAHLHSLQIIHRDVKPSNFLFDEEGHLLLSDFGIALSEGDTRITRTLEQMGTLAYMAPEQRTGTDVTSRVDLYSAALILHELRTGERVASNPGKNIRGKLGRFIRELGAERPDRRPTPQQALAMIDERTRPRDVDPSERGPTSVWFVKRASGHELAPGPASPQESQNASPAGGDRGASNSAASGGAGGSGSWRRILEATGPHRRHDLDTDTTPIDDDRSTSHRLLWISGGIALVAMLVATFIGLRGFGQTDSNSVTTAPPLPMATSKDPPDRQPLRDARATSFLSRPGPPHARSSLRIGIVDRKKFWKEDVGKELDALSKTLRRKLKRKVDVVRLKTFMNIAERLVTNKEQDRIDLGRFSAIQFVLAKQLYPDLIPVVVQESVNPETDAPTTKYNSVFIIKCKFFDGRSPALGRLCRQLGSRTDIKNRRDHLRLNKLLATLNGRDVCLRGCRSSSGFVYPMYHLAQLGLHFTMPPQLKQTGHEKLAKDLLTEASCAIGAVYESIVRVSERTATLKKYQRRLLQGIENGDIKVVTIPDGILKDIFVTTSRRAALSLDKWRQAFYRTAQDGAYRKAIKKLGPHYSRISAYRPVSDQQFYRMRHHLCAIPHVLAKTSCSLIRLFQRNVCPRK